MSCLFLLFIVSNVTYRSVIATGTIDDLMKLEGDLFKRYNKNLRPAYNLGDVVHVDMSLFLMAIIDFDEISGIIQLSSFAGIKWTDYRLAWNSSKYGGISDYVSNSSLVWKPQMFMVSSADDMVKIGDDNFDIRIWNTGTISYNPGIMVKSTCDVDMTYFPTDSHICRIMIVPWMYTIQEVELNVSSSKINLDFFKPNGVWEIYDTSVNRNIQLTTDVSIIEFTLYLKRKPQYFILSLNVPILLLCFLNPCVFLLPVASGERISFAVTMFLSMAVYMSSIGEVMPKVSDPIAGASYFLLGAMCFSCLLILLTILSLCCDVVTDVKHFPIWLLSMVRCCISRNRNSTKGRGDSAQVAGILEKDNHAINDNQESFVELKESVNDGIQKNDVTKFIDRSLFCVSELIVISGSYINVT